MPRASVHGLNVLFTKVQISGHWIIIIYCLKLMSTWITQMKISTRISMTPLYILISIFSYFKCLLARKANKHLNLFHYTFHHTAELSNVNYIYKGVIYLTITGDSFVGPTAMPPLLIATLAQTSININGWSTKMDMSLYIPYTLLLFLLFVHVCVCVCACVCVCV